MVDAAMQWCGMTNGVDWEVVWQSVGGGKWQKNEGHGWRLGESAAMKWRRLTDGMERVGNSQWVDDEWRGSEKYCVVMDRKGSCRIQSPVRTHLSKQYSLQRRSAALKRRGSWRYINGKCQKKASKTKYFFNNLFMYGKRKTRKTTCILKHFFTCFYHCLFKDETRQWCSTLYLLAPNN